MARARKTKTLMTGTDVLGMLLFSFRRLAPVYQLRNPVMFVVYLGAIITSVLSFYHPVSPAESGKFTTFLAIWLWLTILFSNFSEALAEGRGKAQAATLRSARKDNPAKRLHRADDPTRYETVSSTQLKKDDIVLVEAGDIVPGDGQIIEGVASVDESSITGESAPVIRESGGDRDAVTGGTKLLSDRLIIRITSNPGESFLDGMIALVEGAKRQKTPNEISLSILLSTMTLIFLLVTVTLFFYSGFAAQRTGQGTAVGVTVLIALLVCLAPTTIGGLLSAIGIAGMDRLMRVNVIAKSGRAVEAAGDVNVLLLDKTGTITHGNRQAVAFVPADGVTMHHLAEAADLASMADDTPEGKSIVQLARTQYGVKGKQVQELQATFTPFSAETRLSGITLLDRQILKGAGDAIEAHIQRLGGQPFPNVKQHIEKIAREGGTPLLVADGTKILGVIHLKDIIKRGIKERLADLRRMGIKSIMVTGDNPLTAAAIAAEAGVDDFIAQATPQIKLNAIRDMQKGGEMVALVGDGTNDAPALAQADVAVVMNTGTQAAKEAGNMVDLESDPTKLIEVVEIGKQLLMTRGALTTFSISNDLAKYFAIIPLAFSSTYPTLMALNVMRLSSPESGILSAVIFNALSIILLIPLALKGVKYRPVGVHKVLQRHVLVYGLGGVVTPFVGIKLIDMILTALKVI